MIGAELLHLSLIMKFNYSLNYNFHERFINL